MSTFESVKKIGDFTGDPICEVNTEAICMEWRVSIGIVNDWYSVSVEGRTVCGWVELAKSGNWCSHRGAMEEATRILVRLAIEVQA